jgi:hypothetical protein
MVKVTLQAEGLETSLDPSRVLDAQDVDRRQITVENNRGG